LLLHVSAKLPSSGSWHLHC